MKEIWATYKDRYLVSSNGEVLTTAWGKTRPLKIHFKRKYLFTTIFKKPFAIHMLVARCFPEICGEWFEGCEVHHINGIPTDNRAENLIILTKEEHKKIHSNSKTTYLNRSNAQKKVWAEKRGYKNVSLRKPIVVIKDGVMQHFCSQTEAAETLGFSYSTISKYLHNGEEYNGYNFLKSSNA